MAQYYHQTFCGKPIIAFSSETRAKPEEVAFKIMVKGWDEGGSWVDHFQTFLSYPNVEKTTALVVGTWIQEDNFENPSDFVVQALVSAHDRLPNLEALFYGQISSEEFENSWLENTDLSPLLTAYPNLKTLRIRGANGLSLGALKHDRLAHLAIESGGLPRRLLNEVLHHNLPQLKHLELWLGDPSYGFDFELADLQPIFDGARFPHLSYLGLVDSVIADEIAKAVVDAPILDQLQVLDLSMGTLGDEGAQALYDSPRVKNLVRLELDHHYCSDEMMQKMLSLPIEVSMGEQEQEDVYEYNGETHRERYVAVSE